MKWFKLPLTAGLCGLPWLLFAGSLTVGLAPEQRLQEIDGFGTCIGEEGREPAIQALYFDDLGCSIVRMDVTPRFASPYSDDRYHSPWFYKHHLLLTFPPNVSVNDETAGGPEKNNVRTYADAADYVREFGGRRARIAVMGADIAKNIALLDVSETGAIALYQAGLQRAKNPGDVKLIGSLWSPPPWVKIASGNKIANMSGPKPLNGTPWPFIWGGNFSGGRLDVSGEPLTVFDDGTGPTSALQQFARCEAAYIKGLQDRHGIKFYAISVQNELGFEEFYSSCVYPKAEDFLAALKALRAEFDKYPDLADVRLIGPEDLLGGDAYSLWQYGAGNTAQHKNLQFLRALSADQSALDFFCIHGYSPDGKNAAKPDPLPWRWWADGWESSPAPGLPANVGGFRKLGKKSWMTETSGEEHQWLVPGQEFPSNGAFSIALKIHQALTVGRESAWLYWQFIAGDHGTKESLTGKKSLAQSPKYIAAKHFFKFIRPGAVALTVSGDIPNGVMVSAYWNEREDNVVMVLINPNDGEQTVGLALPVTASYQSDAGTLWRVGQGGNGVLKLPARSVTTALMMSSRAPDLP